VLSFLHARATAIGMFKSTMGKMMTLSGHRQRAVPIEVVEEFYDTDVSGADPIETRPGFSALLDRIEGNGVRTVVVEDASRFARQLIVQEAGIIALIERGVGVLTARVHKQPRSSAWYKTIVKV
jgi:DNA invertase Pin-like site-specific DNA recombinase